MKEEGVVLKCKKQTWMDWIYYKTGFSKEEKEVAISAAVNNNYSNEQMNVEKWKVELYVKSANLSLKISPENGGKEERELGMGKMERFRVQISMVKHEKEVEYPSPTLYRTNSPSLNKINVEKTSICVTASLESLQLIDSLTENTLFRTLVSPVLEDPSKAMFYVEFQTNPKEIDADFSIKASSQAVRIVSNVPWILKLVDFFSIPSSLVANSSAQRIKSLQENYGQQMMKGTMDSRTKISTLR